jgi:hypothetical protein
MSRSVTFVTIVVIINELPWQSEKGCQSGVFMAVICSRTFEKGWTSFGRTTKSCVILSELKGKALGQDVAQIL